MSATAAAPVRVSRFGFVNAYLVREDDGLTLIDTLLPRSGRAILRAADGIGAPIVRIVLTHAHGDHIGSLDQLAAALPQAEVLISSRDARLLASDTTLDPGESREKLRGDYRGAATRPTRTFEGGERIGSLEVVAAPGHTPGHVALLDARDRTLYCGDAYSTLGGVATSAKANPRFPLVRMGTWSPALELESARALRALDPRRLAPGHGKVVDSPGAAMERAIAQAAA
ncbi:MAG: fold metallo-hydrolase [Conexibacter sp.]|nr:fold metallo-hydrolase [Conexibacter sp.]